MRFSWPLGLVLLAACSAPTMNVTQRFEIIDDVEHLKIRVDSDDDMMFVVVTGPGTERYSDCGGQLVHSDNPDYSNCDVDLSRVEGGTLRYHVRGRSDSPIPLFPERVVDADITFERPLGWRWSEQRGALCTSLHCSASVREDGMLCIANAPAGTLRRGSSAAPVDASGSACVAIEPLAFLDSMGVQALLANEGAAHVGVDGVVLELADGRRVQGELPVSRHELALAAAHALATAVPAQVSGVATLWMVDGNIHEVIGDAQRASDFAGVALQTIEEVPQRECGPYAVPVISGNTIIIDGGSVSVPRLRRDILVRCMGREAGREMVRHNFRGAEPPSCDAVSLRTDGAPPLRGDPDTQSAEAYVREMTRVDG